MKVYYYKGDLRNVTAFYYGIIIAALRKKNVEVIELGKFSFGELRTIAKSDYFLATDLMTFLRLYLCGRRNFIYWFQGITPEESFMMSGSKWKRWKYSFLEKQALKTVQYKIGVSEYLFQHYEHKYGLKFNKKELFIMPCFNSDFNEHSFTTPEKYEKNIFCYAGGMQAWQGFELIAWIFKEVEGKYPNAFLKVLSKDIPEAERVLSKYGIKNYSVGFVAQEEMDDALAECKFGFIVREDNIVNNVATPTKLGTYIGNGLIPIFTPAIKTFADLSHQYNFLCCVDMDKPLLAIEPYIKMDINRGEIQKEYKRLFEDYYNKDLYIKELTSYFEF